VKTPSAAEEYSR